MSHESGQDSNSRVWNTEGSHLGSPVLSRKQSPWEKARSRQFNQALVTEARDPCFKGRRGCWLI